MVKKLLKKKKLILLAGILVCVIGIGLFVVLRKNARKPDTQEMFTTETAQIERQTLSKSISATGTVASAETKTVNTSLKDLEVVSVYVKEGDYVEEGTVICEFDASDYEDALAEAEHNAKINQQIEELEEANSTNESVENAYNSLKKTAASKNDAQETYEEAAGELDSAKSSLSAKYTAYQNAEKAYTAINDELEATKKSQTLSQYKQAYDDALEALAVANIALSNAQAEFSKASETDSNYSELKNTVDNAKTAVENKKSEAESAKKAYDTAAERYNELLSIETAYNNAKSAYTAAQTAVSTAEKEVEQAKSTLEQMEDQLSSAWDTYDSAVEKADLQEEKEALQDQLISETQEEKAINEYTELIDDCRVVATMSGVITSLNVTEGNVFSGGDVYTIQDNEHFVVSASVDEYDISSIVKGMSAYIKTDATGDTEMTGEVNYVAIAPTNSSSGMGSVSSSASYTIKVSIDQADEKLRAGMTAKLSISLEESKDTLTVPYDAVTTDSDGTSTITVDLDGEKKTITVEKGIETDYYTEIISDEISEGMTVYLTSPLIKNNSENSFEGGGNAMGGFMGGGTQGGGMPGGGNGPSGGGMPSGGGPGGF